MRYGAATDLWIISAKTIGGSHDQGGLLRSIGLLASELRPCDNQASRSLPAEMKITRLVTLDIFAAVFHLVDRDSPTSNRSALAIGHPAAALVEVLRRGIAG
jgi:hypothetical protein